VAFWLSCKLQEFKFRKPVRVCMPRVVHKDGKERPMKYAIAALALFGAGLLSSPSYADEAYRWCAVYHPNEAPLCVFKTLEACQNATSVGGGCNPNLAYDPNNRTTPGRRHHAMRY
jgi:hypothetical protein